jgi:hypothetical protein
MPRLNPLFYRPSDYNKGTCVICGLSVSRYLCKAHRKTYYFDTKIGLFRLKAHLKVSGPQQLLFHAVRHIYCKRSPTIQEVTFPFAPYTRYDIAVVKEKLIIEYDGEQHFIYNPHFFKTVQEFEDYKRRDILKEDIVRREGWTVIRFSYAEAVKDRYYVRGALRRKKDRLELGRSVIARPGEVLRETLSRETRTD